MGNTLVASSRSVETGGCITSEHHIPAVVLYTKAHLLLAIYLLQAMGAAFYYCLCEGVMSVVDPKFHDYFLTRSFDVMLTCNVIFTGMGTVCGEVFFQWRRLGDGHKANFFVIAWNQIKW